MSICQQRWGRKEPFCQAQNPSVVVALAQLGFTLGDVAGNAQRMLRAAERAHDLGARVVVFPELYLSGYHARDLWLRPGFIERCARACEQLRSRSAALPIAMVFGTPKLDARGQLVNAALVLDSGAVLAEHHKFALPNDGVFDERRYFHAPERVMSSCFELDGVRFGLLICEDIWHRASYQHLHSGLCDCVLAPQASPFSATKHSERIQVVRAFCNDSGLALIYVNGHGAQDELIFDGASLAADQHGAVCYQAPLYQDDLALVEFSAGAIKPRQASKKLPSELESIYRGLTLAIRAYFASCKAERALLGLSGGIDSALCAALLADALGANNVSAYALPYKFTSNTSLQLARQQAELLQINYHELSITPAVEALLASLPAEVANDKLVLQNAQARARALLLMACSNHSGALLVACSNKSESAMGYATLYGDMAGAIAPLQDIYKTQVWRLARWRNQQSPALLNEIIEREPTAELMPGQKDSDSLPEYPVLDGILRLYLDQHRSPEAIAAAGYDLDLARRICRQVEASEYKRRQAALSFRVSNSAPNLARRYPIGKRMEPDD